MSLPRILSLVHLGIAVFGLLKGDIVLFILNILCFGIMDSNAGVASLEKRVKALESPNEKDSKQV